MTALDKFLKYTSLTALSLIFFIPFIVSTDLIFPFITGKAFAFRVLVEIAFASWLILAIRRPEFRPKQSMILISLITFLVVIGIANISGENPYHSFWSIYERMEGYITMLHLFAFFLVGSTLITTKKSWFNILAISSFVSMIMIWLGLNQLANPETISQGGRLDATFGNPIYLAIYNLFHIFFAGILIFNRDFFKNNWWKIIFGIIGFGHLLVLYHTNTRGAILGLVAGVGLVALLNIFNTKKSTPKIWKASIGLLVAGIILIAGFLVAKDTDFVQNNKVLVRFAEINLESGTSGARVLNWQVALTGFKEKPILGYGMGNYSVVYDKDYDPRLHGNEAWFDHVHNVILDWLIAGGILGLLAYLLIFAALIYQIYRSENYSNLEKNLFFGILFAYLVQNLFVFDSQVTYILFFLILAIFANEKVKQINIFQVSIPKTIQNVFAALIIILLPIVIYQLNAPGYFAAKSFINSLTDISIATQFVQMEQSPELITQRIDSAIKEMEKAVEYNSFGNYEIIPRSLGLAFTTAQIGPNYYPPEKTQEYIQNSFGHLTSLADIYSYDAKINYITMLNFAKFNSYEASLNYAEKLIEVSPNKQVTRIPVAQVYFNVGMEEQALLFMKETYELDPSKDDVWLEYYNMALKADSEVAQEILNEALKGDSLIRVKTIESKLINSLENNPDNINYYVSLSTFYFKTGQLDKSLEVLKNAQEKFPEMIIQLQSAIDAIKNGENPVGREF